MSLRDKNKGPAALAAPPPAPTRLVSGGGPRIGDDSARGCPCGVATLARRYADALRSLGLRQGDRVIVLLKPCIVPGISARRLSTARDRSAVMV